MSWSRKAWALALPLALFCSTQTAGAQSAPGTTPSQTTAPKISQGSPGTAKLAPPELDITSPVARSHRNSAYTLVPGQWGIRTGLLGTGGDDLYGALGVNYGLPYGLQVGANLLHVSAGMLNLMLKWNFIEHGPWAFSAQFAPAWIHGDWVWLSSDNQVIGNIDILAFPVGATSTFHATDWLQFDLNASYTDVEIFGDLNSSSLAFNTQLAVRQFKLTPSARLHIKKRLSLHFSAAVPLWTQVPGTIEAEATLAPGVVAGGRSAGAKTTPFGELYLFTLGARSMISQRTFVDFSLTYGSVTKRLYGNSLYPKLGLEFRF